MNTYQQKPRYDYQCPECKDYVKGVEKIKKCSKCGIELCKKCAKKHHHFCVWCYNEIENEYLWKHKFTTFFLIFLPLLVLILPAPLPMIVVLFTAFKIELLIIMFIYLGVVIPLVFSLRIYYKRKMVNSILLTGKTFNT